MSEKKTKFPFWLAIVLILLMGIIASIFAFIYVKQDNERKRIEALPKYTVIFAYQDGTVIDTKEVREGFGIFPPDFNTDDIFRGWSSGINNITSSIEVHPMIYTPVEDNLFCFDSVYVKEGDDFSIDLFVTGNVDFVDCNLEMEYDQNVIDYKSDDCESFCKIERTEDGKLSIAIDSESRITQKTKLAAISFHAKEKDVYSSEITLASKGANIFDDTGQKKPVDSATINNQIYFLQEVR